MLDDRDEAPRAYEVPLQYESVVLPRYARQFADLLLSAVDIPARANILDLSCRTGHVPLALLSALREGRVVGIDDDPSFLDVARMRIGEEVGRRVFLSQASVDALPFGDQVFTNVVGNLVDRTTTDRGALLAEAARVLRPQGQLVLTMPLRGSFAEVLDVFREVALKYDLPGVAERVDQYALSMPTSETWHTELASRGFDRAEVSHDTFALEYPPGEALLNDPAALIAAAPEWQWCAMGTDDAETVLYRVQETIQTYFHGRSFELTVVAGCISARRG